MALQIILGTAQSNGCKTLTIYDTTGAYNVSTNPTGWKTVSSGGTNVEIDNSSITVATLTIVIGTVVLSLDLMNVATWRAITPYTTGQPFDSTTDPTTLSYTITDQQLASIPDGIATITCYIEDTNAVVASATFTIAMYCHIKCALNKAICQIPNYYKCITCNNEYIDTVVTMWGMYKAMKLAACEANLAGFTTILTNLTNICATLNLTC